MVSSPNMQIVSAEALLLDVFNLHDFDRIVTYLTADQGKKKGFAAGLWLHEQVDQQRSQAKIDEDSRNVV